MPKKNNKVLIYEKKGPLAYITFNRPEIMNAMNTEIYTLLEASVKDFTADDNLLCAIISGADGNFSSGMDLKEGTGKQPHTEKYPDYDIFPAYKAIDRCPKPIIAAIDGYCLASGFNCAVLYCDIRIATERAKFGIPAVKRGSAVPYPLPFTWHMSLGNALYMVLTAKILNAEEALRMGIVSELVPHEKLMERATELAKTIAESSPIGVRSLKQYMRRFVEMPGSEGQRLVQMVMDPIRASEESNQKYDEAFAEGRKAFREKRSPKFKKSRSNKSK